MANEINVEIPHDSNMLDKGAQEHCCFRNTHRGFYHDDICKFHCDRISLVYLENAHGNSSRAFRNKVPRYAHRRMRTDLVCHSRQIQPYRNVDNFGDQNKIRLVGPVKTQSKS